MDVYIFSWVVKHMKIGIVYYSRTGNTRQVANMLQEKFKEKKAEVDLIEIEHEKKPGFFTAGRSAMKQQELPILNKDFDMEKYNLVVIGSPTWAGHPTPFMKTFLEKAKNMKGKNVAMFGTGMSPIGVRQQFMEIMKNTVTQAGAKSIDAFLAVNFKRGRLTDGQQHIDAFITNCLKK
jgi:flavodoxin